MNSLGSAANSAPNLRVTELNRYPLKSAAPETLESAEIGFTGIAFDRHWMVISESGRFISQREKGAQKLSLVRALVDDDGIELIAPDTPSLSLPLENPAAVRRTVELHDKHYEGLDAGDAAARWISDYLPKWKGESFRVVYFPSDFVRSTQDIYTQEPGAVTEFADGYAVLVANQASCDDLNRRLIAKGIEPVLMNVFRPNIVYEGGEAWGEDDLRRVRIGDAVLEIIKPCGRCPITGVTQELGRFSRRPLEPRETLAEFHAGRDLVDRFPNLEGWLHEFPMFGQNAIVVTPGKVHRGDDIEVLSRR